MFFSLAFNTEFLYNKVNSGEENQSKPLKKEVISHVVLPEGKGPRYGGVCVNPCVNCHCNHYCSDHPWYSNLDRLQLNFICNGRVDNSKKLLQRALYQTGLFALQFL
jgi:hypothetical protein